MNLRNPRPAWIAAFLGVVVPVFAELQAQDTGSQSVSPPVENVPSDLLEPALSPRDGSADRFARVFSAELRDIEERQAEILDELDTLPRLSRGTLPTNYVGYHDGGTRQRKWVQVDLGEPVEPEAIALFPVTEQVEDEIVFGYGFPRRFQVDISNDPNFIAGTYETMIDSRVRSRFSPREAPFYQDVSGFSGRYVRVTVLNRWRPEGEGGVGREAFALGELMVLVGKRNRALGTRVTAADSAEMSARWSPRFLTDGKTNLGVPHSTAESPTLGFRVELKKATEASVQIDLEESMSIEEIRLIPANPPDVVTDPAIQFPTLVRLEISDDPDMRKADQIRNLRAGQILRTEENPVIVQVKEGYGRYVRLTAQRTTAGPLAFALSEMQILSDGRNVALGKTVTSRDSVEGEGWSRDYLVNGYSSRNQLASYPVWLEALSQRGELISEWRELESLRIQLVEVTLGRGMRWGGIGGGAVIFMVVYSLALVRVNRRREIERIRQQIASDLHDDIGSNLSSIALLAELGHSEVEEPELAREEFEEIKKTADKTVESMRDIVWLIRPGEETWKQLLTRFRETAAKLLKAHEYQFYNRGTMHDERLPLDFKRDLFLIYKEVLNNIVKHAEAHRVHIDLETRRGRLLLKITDDGKGFDNLDQNFREGNGLKNLRLRAQHLGANLKVHSASGEGTTVQLAAPIP